MKYVIFLILIIGLITTATNITNYRINIAFDNVILHRLNGVTLTTLYPSNENERRTTS